MNKTFISMAVISFVTLVSMRTNNLPLKEWDSNTDKPLVFYISGDGGMSSFSEGLCAAINKEGYKLTALDSKSYFYEKKTPQQTTNDIVAYLNKEFSKRKNQQFVLAGYSFGAEIVPFVVHILPDSVKKKLISVVLLSPSTSTDFETHIWDMFGWKKKRGMDVIAEINKMGAQKTILILGNDENDFPVNDIKLKNYEHVQLPGGHHYEGNSSEVAKAMIKNF